jgi:hypothetical protein
VIAVPVGDVDRGQVPAAGDDPVQLSLRLVDGEEGVDEDRIAAAADERRAVRHPGQVLAAGRQVAAQARPLEGENLPREFGVGPGHPQAPFTASTAASILRSRSSAMAVSSGRPSVARNEEGRS